MATAHLIWSLLFGSIGIGYFVYGRKQSDVIVRYVGVALMAFPYFVSNIIALVLIGIGLLLLPKFIRM